MVRYNSKSLIFHIFLVIASIGIGGIEYANDRCGLNCTAKQTIDLSNDIVSPASHMLTSDCCCVSIFPCVVDNIMMTYIFNVPSVKNFINKDNHQQLYYLLRGNNLVLILKMQQYRDRFRHLFRKKHPIYLLNSSLIC